MFAPYDREQLRRQFQEATPFPFTEFPSFLEPETALEICRAYPTIDTAAELGKQYTGMNERGKVEITDLAHFPEPVQRLHTALGAPDFIEDLEYITGIDNLLPDPTLNGGGMHMTGPRGRLDVHVDFNFMEQTGLHRRLNLLLYLNPEWPQAWGGEVEFWDRDIKTRCHSFLPRLNRCLLFATSEISFHGVSPVKCPSDVARKSFAAYYYTREAPNGWDGTKHSTIFKPRPNEGFRGTVLMPLEKVWRFSSRKISRGLQNAAKALKQRSR